MALITGNNTSGKLFDVVGEEGEVLGSFHAIHEAIECGKTAPWWAGNVNIRRDRTINYRNHAASMESQRKRILALYA